jgi:hypothetical protein
MRFRLPFGYDAVGKVDREIQDGHNYRIAWHDLEIEEVEPVNAPVATRWAGGETIFLNGRHYAKVGHVTRPFSQPGSPWLVDISTDDMKELAYADLSKRSRIPALELVISTFSQLQYRAFDEFNVKRREKKPPQFIWSNIDERRAEIDSLSETLIVVDGQVLIVVNEPIYRLSNWRDKATIDVILISPTAINMRRDREKFYFFRADRFEDALDLAHRSAGAVDVRPSAPIEVLIPNSIQACDDLQALLDAAEEVLELGKRYVLDTISTEQAMTWLRLRDTTRLPIQQLDGHDLLLEHLSAFLVVLRTLPNNWDQQLKRIGQQIERWQMRPVTSARGR